MSLSGSSASRRISWAHTRLAVTWSIALPMKTIRSLRSCWKIRPEESRSAPAATIWGDSNGWDMAARLVAGAGTRRHSAVSSQVTGTPGTAAGVAELADAPGLGPGPRKGVEVRVLSPAPDTTLGPRIPSANGRGRRLARRYICHAREVPRGCIGGLGNLVYSRDWRALRRIYKLNGPSGSPRVYRLARRAGFAAYTDARDPPRPWRHRPRIHHPQVPHDRPFLEAVDTSVA